MSEPLRRDIRNGNLDNAAVNPLRDPSDLRLPRIAGSSGMVIFGVTGDLARRKLLPAIYDLAHRGLLPAGFTLVGFGRRGWSHEEFRQYVRQAVETGARTEFNTVVWDRLAKGMRFAQGNFDEDRAFDSLYELLQEMDATRGTAGNWAFYLSIPPWAFPKVCNQLKRTGMAEASDRTWRRVIIEKPFGHDLESAQELNRIVGEVFPESSVFRIDHYLGKETVQNLMALRFANSLFEPFWNSQYIDHVQITMAEDIGLGGRAGYYDGIGAARDVIQNHLIQLMALVSMDEPTTLRPKELSAAKTRVLRSIHPVEPLAETTARGQYSSGWQGSEWVRSLREEDGFDPNSNTETYAACTLEIASRRWAGVPFYLRTGKRLGRRVTEIALIFKSPGHQPFGLAHHATPLHNAVVIRVQPDEGVLMRFASKVPGQAAEIRDVNMDFSYAEAFTEESPEAYERLILDALLDESSLFPTAEEVELSWQILDPILDFWRSHGRPDSYPAGTWGPESADRMLARTGRTWRRP